LYSVVTVAVNYYVAKYMNMLFSLVFQQNKILNTALIFRNAGGK